MIYNSQNTINIATLFSLEKYHILYRFNNGYGASVIGYHNSEDIELSVIYFVGEDIFDHVITTDTFITTESLMRIKTDDFVNKMIQIENLI